MNQFIEQLKKMEACQPALKWIEKRGIDTVEEFWKVSDRPDWMLWLVYEEYPGIDIPIRVIQDIAIEFAEMVLPYAGQKLQVCIDCIYAIWQYLEDWIDIDKLIEKRDAAYATDVNAAWAAARAADAAYSANWAVNVNARLQIRKWQADMIRMYVPKV